MIMDEVQTGVGRTGKMWGYENLDIIPDVFTSAKAIGGGVPLGAMMCREKFNVFGPGDHASTYGKYNYLNKYLSSSFPFALLLIYF